MIKIEIWSDVVCPFCYIGKRHFEKALESFPEKDQVTIEWKSFMLNPDLVAKPGQTISQYLSEAKGISVQQAEQMNEHVSEMAQNAGLNYNLKNVVVANSMDAHRIIQLAKTKGLADKAEEIFFKAYFCDAKNISDPDILKTLGQEIGIDATEIDELLSGDNFSVEVFKEYEEASQIGIRGVPFFVVNRKYGISGAQPVQVFTDTLRKALSEEKVM